MNQPRIVVGIGHMPRDLQALTHAADEARSRGLPLRIVHVISGDSVSDCWQAEAITRQAAAYVRAQGDAPDISTETIIGPTEKALAQQTGSGQILVIGRVRRRDCAAPGPVEIARRAAGPVVVVPSVAAQGVDIVAAVEDAAQTTDVLEFALEVANIRQARLTVARLYSPSAGAPNPQTELTGYPDVAVTELAAEAAPARILMTASAYAQLIVVSTRPEHNAVAGSSGGICDLLIRHSVCPIAVLPARKSGLLKASVTGHVTAGSARPHERA
jgi:nucleotide-binding universal stress UspA family protein